MLSGLGDGLEVAALPLLAAGLTRDPRLVAGLSAAATLPWLVFGLVSGAIVDRCDRARLMVRVNVARTVLVAGLAVMVATRTARIEVVYVLVFLLGVGETLFNTAAQAVLPAIVSTEQLETANGRLEVGELVTETFVGPPVGALIFAAMAALPFAIDAASFAVAAVLLQGLVTPGVRSTAETSGPGLRPPGLRPLYQQLLSDIGEGLRWLGRHRLLRSLCVVMGLANFAVYLTQGILVLFAVEKLHVSRHYYGFLLTGIAIGGIAGGFWPAGLGPDRTGSSHPGHPGGERRGGRGRGIALERPGCHGDAELRRLCHHALECRDDFVAAGHNPQGAPRPGQQRLPDGGTRGHATRGGGRRPVVGGLRAAGSVLPRCGHHRVGVAHRRPLGDAGSHRQCPGRRAREQEVPNQ